MKKFIEVMRLLQKGHQFRIKDTDRDVVFRHGFLWETTNYHKNSSPLTFNALYTLIEEGSFIDRGKVTKGPSVD